MPPMTGSDVNRNIPMPNAQYKQPEIDGNSQAIPSDTAEDLPSSSRDSTYPPAIVSELSMPNPQLLQLQLISPRLEWNRKLDLNRRNILEEMIERFDRVCYDSMPNPDHARLAKMFAIILFNGTPYVLGNARFQNAYSRWMNSADYETAMWGFYEYCYLPVYCSFMADPTLPSPMRENLAGKLRMFVSMGVRDFPRPDYRPFKVNRPMLELKDWKMLYRARHVEFKKATKQIPNSKNPYLLERLGPPGEGSKQLQRPYTNPFLSLHEAGQAGELPQECEPDSQDDLMFRAFKPRHLENPTLFKRILDDEKELWEKLERQAMPKHYESTFTHSCKCSACVDTFGIENC